jgi:hypothetical protein
MNEIRHDQLKFAIESQHGGTATFVQAVPVKETFEGATGSSSCRSRLVSDAADETAVKISRAVIEIARARYPDVTAFLLLRHGHGVRI